MLLHIKVTAGYLRFLQTVRRSALAGAETSGLIQVAPFTTSSDTLAS